MATMNVSLPDEMREWVEQQAKSGRYANASDYVRDLIRHDQDARDIGGWTEDELWAELQPALDSLDRGESIPAEQVFAEVRARIKEIADSK